MKLLDTANKWSKEEMYGVYTTLIYNVKRYDKITRKKMMEEVIQVYHQIDVIPNYIDYEEYEILQSLKNGKEVLINETGYLPLKFLVIDDGIYAKIPEELEDVIEHLETWEQQIKEKQKFRDCARGILNKFGVMNHNQFIMILKIMMELEDDEELFNQLESDVFLMYFYDFHEDDIDFGHIYLKTLDYYVEDILYKQEYYQQTTLPPLDDEELIRIGKYQYDIEIPQLKKLYEMRQTLGESIITRLFFKDFFTTCHMQNDLDLLFRSYSDYFKDCESVMKEAYPYIPSAALNGMSPIEYEKSKEKGRESDAYYDQGIIQTDAKLSEDDCVVFYDVFFGLLEFANKTLRVSDLKRLRNKKHLDTMKVVEIRDALFLEHLELIDAFVKQNPFHFDARRLKIVEGFKRGIFDTFLVVSYKEDGTIVIGQNDKGYKVLGLYSNIDEILYEFDLPLVSRMLLLPFEGKIICDGLIETTPMNIGPNMRKNLIEEMKHIKIIDKL